MHLYTHKHRNKYTYVPIMQVLCLLYLFARLRPIRNNVQNPAYMYIAWHTLGITKILYVCMYVYYYTTLGMSKILHIYMYIYIYLYYMAYIRHNQNLVCILYGVLQTRKHMVHPP
jgi:hypothetical protein